MATQEALKRRKMQVVMSSKAVICESDYCIRMATVQAHIPEIPEVEAMWFCWEHGKSCQSYYRRVFAVSLRSMKVFSHF